jgi:hypothetical protein
MPPKQRQDSVPFSFANEHSKIEPGMRQRDQLLARRPRDIDSGAKEKRPLFGSVRDRRSDSAGHVAPLGSTGR